MKIACCWIYAIDKYGYPPGWKDTLKSIKEIAGLGFRNIELEGVEIPGLAEENLNEVYQKRKYIKKLCADIGLNIINFLPVIPDIISLNKNKRKRAFTSFNRALEIASYFECAHITTDSFTVPLEFINGQPYRETEDFGKDFGRQYQIKVNPDFKWEQLWNRVIDSFSECSESAKKARIRFAIEPRVGEILSSTDAILRLLDVINDENLGVVFDTAHLNAQKELLPLSIEKLGRRIFYVHVADNDSRDNQHLGIGKGTIDWEGVFTALKKHRFDGYMAVDIGNVANLDEEFREAQRFLKNLGESLLL